MEHISLFSLVRGDNLARTNLRLAFFSLSCYTSEEVPEGDSPPTWS